MKKIISLLLVLAFTPQLLSAKEDDIKEHNHLILQCQNIRSRILQENNFEIIKKVAMQNHQRHIAELTQEFTSLGNNALSSHALTSQLDNARAQLQNSLAVLETEHNLRINSLIAQTIIAFLMATNTKIANKLLAELIANGFTF